MPLIVHRHVMNSCKSFGLKVREFWTAEQLKRSLLVGGYHLLFTALQVCWWVLSTSALTQTYCWCKSHSSHTHTALSPWILKQYAPGRLTLSSIHPHTFWWNVRQTLQTCCLEGVDVGVSTRLPGTQECWSVFALMHRCSQTDDTPPDLSVHLPPQSRFTALFSAALFARGALFSSVLNELNGQAAKGTANSKHHI